MQYFSPKLIRNHACLVVKLATALKMSKTIIGVRHFGLGHRKSLETAVRAKCFDGLFNHSRLLKKATVCAKFFECNLNKF